MGYTMKRGNSAVSFKTLGSSPVKQSEGFGPHNPDKKDKKKKPDTHASSEPSIEEQLKLRNSNQSLKDQCAKNGGVWDTTTGTCKKTSPAKQKVDPDAPGTPGTPGFEPPVTSMDYLTKTPNPTAKAEKVDHSKTLSTHLDSRGPIKGDYQMENKGDFNISNLHKDTKISLDKKKMNKGISKEKMKALDKLFQR